MKRVYVVDDDRDIVEYISTVLQSAGYEIGAQFDVQGIVDNVAEFAADLVILDVMFPEDPASGFEAARALKSDDRTSAVPILMLSAVNETGTYTGSLSNRDRERPRLPVQEFVEKPVGPRELLEKVGLLCPT